LAISSHAETASNAAKACNRSALGEIQGNEFFPQAMGGMMDRTSPVRAPASNFNWYAVLRCSASWFSLRSES
jgi:hypothetical protein